MHVRLGDSGYLAIGFQALCGWQRKMSSQGLQDDVVLNEK
jgi:hypothetical protein